MSSLFVQARHASFKGGLVALALTACGAESSVPIGPAGDDGGGTAADTGVPSDGSGPRTDASASSDGGDSGTGAEGGTESGGASDGTPNYTASCTPLSQQNGTAINTTFGRLDGTLAYVVPQGGPGSCNGDSSHVHLQVRMLGNIYDVAVDIGKFSGDAYFDEADMAEPDGAWSEGWHGTDSFDYVQLGIHSNQFTSEDPTSFGQKVQSELTNVNHISVFCTAYAQGNGCHDVHYHGGRSDGAIVIRPLAAPPHILFFRFSTDNF